MERKKICIIGVGLIGGSLALQLHDKKLSSVLLGVDANPEHAKQAIDLELVDLVVDLDEAILNSDVIILAIPVDSIIRLLPSILDRVEKQIVLDMGSTKAQIVDNIKQHTKRGRYVATHPMWGTEYSGPASARKGAFENKAAIICNPEQSDEDALDWVRHMYKKIGMHILEMDARSHDLHAAYVSHISHITSFSLANTVLEKEKEENTIFELASSGFESTVRLAKSHPAMWVPIFLQNRENVLDVLDEHILQLNKFREVIEKNDSVGLIRLIEEANKIKQILK